MEDFLNYLDRNAPDVLESIHTAVRQAKSSATRTAVLNWFALHWDNGYDDGMGRMPYEFGDS